MKKVTILDKIRSWIGDIGFRLLIWGYKTTPNDYWNAVYNQEADRKYEAFKADTPF